MYIIRILYSSYTSKTLLEMKKPKDAIWEKFEACYRQDDVTSMLANDSFAINDYYSGSYAQ